MWTAKVRCINVLKLDNQGFEIGKVYDIVDGKFILPNGSKSYRDYDDIYTVNENFYATFEEVKE